MGTFDDLYERWLADYRERHSGAIPDETLQRMARAAALRGDVPPPPLRSVPPKITPPTISDVKTVFGLSWTQLGRLWIGWGPMKEILTQLWTNPTYFKSVCKFAIISIVGAFVSGKIIVPAPYEGWVWAALPFLAALGVGIPSGQTNPTPEEIKQIAHDPDVIAGPKPPTP